MNCINEVIEKQDVSQDCFAVKLWGSYNVVSSYVQNSQQLQIKILHEITDLLAVDVNDLLVSLVSNKLEVK
jgi:putative transcriptional regulator